MTDEGLLKGEKVRLRALEPEDIEILYAWENDPRVWGMSGTLAPFSRETLREFIENQKYDIYRTRQLRLVISRLDASRGAGFSDCVPSEVSGSAGSAPVDVPVGFIDLYDFDPVNLRAGVGILICEESERRKGYAGEALKLVCDYASAILGLHQLYATVEAENIASQSLFCGVDFVRIALLKDWSRRDGIWSDEIVYQKIFV